MSMTVLGISGRRRQAAAALAIDGRVVAAASEDSFTRVPGIGYAQTGGFPAGAVEACLRGAGLEAADVAELTVVEDSLGPEALGRLRADGASASLAEALAAASLGPDAFRVRGIAPLQADAIHAAASTRADAVLVCSSDPPGVAAFVRRDDRLHLLRAVDGGDGLAKAAGRVAATLGLGAGDPFQAIDRLSLGGEPEFDDELAPAIRWQRGGFAVDDEQVCAAIGRVAGSTGASLADAASLNVRTQSTRRALAASFTVRLAEVIAAAAGEIQDETRAGVLAFGGDLFANLRVTAEIQRAAPVAAVPEAAGRALGAALSPFTRSLDRLDGLALGPAYSDDEIKRTLDNCRLDYVYEPDWPRLLLRTSRTLAQGKVVGWFQGAMGFGPRALGTRSILCDPSSRYARHNVNEYLRQVPLDEPLPVLFAPSAVGECLDTPLPAGPAVADAAVRSAWWDRLGAALDWRRHVRVHAPGPSHAAEVIALVECHRRETGVPALIETNLAGPGEPAACTPRDAVRTVYSSAVDALVIGRFILMKDHWLLRTHAG
jgi:carbamoyltransferase